MNLFRFYKFALLIAVYSILVFAHTSALAQGCSDAGFCTMGAMRPNQAFSTKLDVRIRSVELTQYSGVVKSGFGMTIQSTILDVNIGITKSSILQVKIPLMITNGNLGGKTGVGDISLSFTQNLVAKERFQVNATLGAKIPTNNSNLKVDNRPLPMYYQTSLGSYDLVLGGSIISKKWLFAAGVQKALTENGNEFTWGAWKSSSDSNTTLDYIPTKHLKRGLDVMLRAERNFRFSRWNFYAGLLPIFRVTPDEITNAKTGERQTVSGTTGMALSFIGGAGYTINAHSSIKLLGGYRLTRRKEHIDGLTREYVVTLGYQYKF